MDAILITAAFLAGMVVRKIGLPPMVGFLIAGFVLKGFNQDCSDELKVFADFGVTLLLFTIGLKLKLGSLARPEVWAGTTIHMAATTVVVAAIGLGLGALGLPLFDQLTLATSLVLGFALSFSSTVFAAKAFEERAELATRHATAAIGILIMQDVIAVVFLSASKGVPPSPWALALLLLPLARKPLTALLEKVGHGELLLLFGFVATFAGYGLFEFLKLKGDLGAIAFGMLLASSPKAGELAKTLFHFKDLFLVAFFLSIGLEHDITMNAVVAALILLPLVAPKALGYFLVLSGFRLRMRPSFLASLGLANFSEFGLIVGTVAVTKGWLSGEWLVAIALLVGFSFVVASPLNALPNQLYALLSKPLRRFERRGMLPEDMPIRIGEVDALIFGMGRVGTGTYDWLIEHRQLRLLGIDSCPSTVEKHQAAGRNVALADATDPGFWERLDLQEPPRMVFIATRNFRATRRIARRILALSEAIRITAVVEYPDEAEELRELGVATVLDVYREAGLAFAAESWNALEAEGAA